MTYRLSLTEPAATDEFLLNPEIVFLNHGSFGACPRPVLDRYQELQRQMERDPVLFLDRLAPAMMAESRAALGRFLNVEACDLVYFQNPTSALNVVLRSLTQPDGPGLRLKPGDEVLSTDHEYGALRRSWRFLAAKSCAALVERPIPLPVTTPDEWVERFWAGVTERTRVIFLSHITSPTALCFPVAEVCRRAREAGILTIVDGAHAPGQVPLDLAALGADVYSGACHKWLCAPKGAAFLYVRRELQYMIEPLVVSWGWESESPGASRFVDHNEWQGTRDISAFLTVPAAIAYQSTPEWQAQRERCRALAQETRTRLHALTGLPPVCPDGNGWFYQMFAAPLPSVDEDILKDRLYDEYRIEVPIVRWNRLPFIRVSFQAYNSRSDAGALLHALEQLLPNA